MTTTARKPAAAKPQSQATGHASKKQQENMLRLGVFLIIVLLVAFPSVPSPLFGVDWLRSAAPSLTILLEKMPPEPVDLMLFTIVPQPIGQWLYWGLAAFLAFIALTLFMHVGAIYAQRTRPLGQPRTYLRVTVPASATGKPADAVSLLKALHGMVPPINPMQPTPAPVMLCWTARPERKTQQAVSLVAPPTLITGVQKRLQGITGGTKVVVADDPLLAELKPGRFLCVAEARAVAGDALPIAVVGREHGLLAAMLPALVPQTGVIAAGVRIMAEPISDRLWRLDVLAMLERMKLDAGTEEQQALKAKAAGPSYRTQLLLIAVADEPQAGVAQVQTMGSSLAGTAQSVGLTAQRLQAGPVQVFPAVIAPTLPLPKAQRWIGFVLGLLLALGVAAGLWFTHLLPAPSLLWAVPVLVLWIPLLLIASQWRKRQQADQVLRYGAIISGVMRPRNPRVVPLWWPWLGYKD